MKEKISLTSLMSAFGRAYISGAYEKPVFKDDVAKKLFSSEEYEEIKKNILSGIDFFAPEKKDSFKNDEEALDYLIKTQIAPTPVARARFCEDKLKAEIRTGVCQYVILGAGLDTFAFREKELMKKITVFEADREETQRDKLSRIKRANLEIPENLKFVSVDFGENNLAEKLVSAGFDTNKKTFFSWLGVSYYLSQSQIENLFSELSKLAPDGSSVVFDYADGGLFESKIKRVQNMIAMAEAGGEAMKCCIDEPDLQILLDRSNFLIYESLSRNEIQEMYFSKGDDSFTSFENISFCQAVLKGRKVNNTKDTILKTALELFSKNGYEAVSVRDISGKIGITQAALYKHFKNKRDIFDKIIEHMEQDDFNISQEYTMPYKTHDESPEQYKNKSIDKIFLFTIAQYKHWTEDKFASEFRKMLMLEQYKNDEASRLFSQYLSGGPLEFMEEIFAEMINDKKKAAELALSFYSPVFFLIMLYDTGYDKGKLMSKLICHLDNFINEFKKD